MAHTPAPWFIEADTGFGASYHMRRAVITADEHEANARLIAAAPDMLAALRGMVATFAHNFEEGVSPTVDLARAALAKAVGEAA
jgi:hypothetical protein